MFAGCILTFLTLYFIPAIALGSGIFLHDVFVHFKKLGRKAG